MLKIKFHMCPLPAVQLTVNTNAQLLNFYDDFQFFSTFMKPDV